MGIYLNPGNENFKEMLAAPIYVDKTMMIRSVNQMMDEGNKYICVSRPRRFGKTFASNMLNAYFSKGCDSRELFEPFKIAEEACFGSRLNKVNVIKIDMNSEYQNTMDKTKIFSRLERKIRDEMTDQFPDVRIYDDDSAAECILSVYSATGETFVILIDEYDIFVREQVEQRLFDEFLSFLNGLFKSDTVRPAISLAYLTGILPIVRDKIQSKLNNFEEYTILDAGQLAEYIGFTSEEVKALCMTYGVDYDECRQWYDGYRQHGFEIYNPESVVKAINRKTFSSYWGKTSAYTVISDRISANFAGTKDDVIRMLAGERVDVNPGAYLNTMKDFHTKDDAFGYLMHVGYLAYNMEDKTCRIPNREVRGEWELALKRLPDEYAVTNEIIASSKQLLAETFAGNGDAAAKALDISHIHVTSNRSYNNEDALQSAIYLAFIYALNSHTCVKEMTAWKGFADVVYIPVHPGKPAMIIELKRNNCTESALFQIREKKYFDSLSHYTGNLLFAGINYDDKKKTHACKIETFYKE